MSVSHHEEMLLDLYDEEMARMKESGLADLMTKEALEEHCEYIARDMFEGMSQ